MILNQVQAEAVYIAMRVLTGVGATVKAEFHPKDNNDEIVNVAECSDTGKVAIIVGWRLIECYIDQAAFAAAYNLG